MANLLSSSMFLGEGGRVINVVVSSLDIVFNVSKTHTVVTVMLNSVAG